MTTKNLYSIVGKGDQHLSSALESIPDLHVRFASNNDDQYTFIPENDQKKRKKSLRNKSNTPHEFDRQISTIDRKIDQFQAARYGNLGQLKMLVPDNDSNYATFFNRLDPESKLTALHYAARFHHYHICEYLIEVCKVDINKAGEDGMTPLHYVARFRVEKDSQVGQEFIFYFIQLVLLKFI